MTVDARLISYVWQLYVFEIVSAQGSRKEQAPRRSLRLLFTEDLKAPIANVSALNCYLLHSVGLKVSTVFERWGPNRNLTFIAQIYAKAFDQDERLLAVGFLDVGVHTTCIRTLKNLILVGDAVKGLSFIAFQVEVVPRLIMKLGC
jgi:cleavage and polyadenylation specificity factor subunit 1